MLRPSLLEWPCIIAEDINSWKATLGVYNALCHPEPDHERMWQVWDLENVQEEISCVQENARHMGLSPGRCTQPSLDMPLSA